jgi:hypothetical protein
MTQFRKGDRVQISCEGRTIDGEVILASGNGRSLAIAYEGILAGFVALMPVIQDRDGNYAALSRTPVELKKIERG